MHDTPNDDRRKASRQRCQHDYLKIADHPAVLVDWSFGGLGVRFNAPTELEVSQEVDIRIFDATTDQWETLDGIVRWVDAENMVGLEFKDADQRAIGILLRLLGNRLTEVKI